MLLKIIDKYQIDKDKTVLIGDSHKDLFAAKSAGIDSILVNWGFSNHKNSAVNTTEDLRDILLMYPQEITNLLPKC
jgi:phosphoglycolate phosphatase